MFKIPVGLYEKELPASLSCEERLATAGQAGYDFVEIRGTSTLATTLLSLQHAVS
jgi:L-ribulose-5-phosphate 3-epimerase UlaE